MNLQFTQEELDFKKEVRDWIKENYPDDMKERLMNAPNGHVTKEESMLSGSKLYILKDGQVSIGLKNMGVHLLQLPKNIFLVKKWQQQGHQDLQPLASLWYPL